MIYSLVYIVLTALSSIVLNGISPHVPPGLTLLCITLISIAYFHLVNWKHISWIYQQAWQAKKMWGGSMVAIALMWIGTLYATSLIQPTMYVLLFFVCSCLCGIVSTYLEKKTFLLLLSGIGLLACTSVQVLYFLRLSFHHPDAYLGVALSAMSGIAGFAYSKQSFWLAKTAKLSASQILAIRFWLILPLCCFLLPHAPLSYMTPQNITILLGTAFLSLIIPIFIYLKSILSIGPEKTVILCGATPIVTYLLEILLLHHYDSLMLTFTILSALFIVIATWARFRSNQ